MYFFLEDTSSMGDGVEGGRAGAKIRIGGSDKPHTPKRKYLEREREHLVV